jgi:hypothetical protein
MPNTNIKKLLLLANILLLILVCFLVVKAANGRASEIASERMAKVCGHIVTQIDSGTMSLTQAAGYAREQARAGDYVPTVNVFQGADGIVIETNDPSVMVNILKKKESKFARVNCSELAKL